MRLLTRSLIALALLVLLAACDPVTGETTTTLDALPAPDLPGPTSSTTTTVSPPVANDPSPHTYRGYLPNGTDYEASLPGGREETMILVQGVFFFQGDAGQVPVGEVRYTRVSDPPVSGFDSGILRISAEDWLVEVIFLEQMTDQLGPDAEEVITRAIGIESRDGWPVLQLSSPFTWGDQGALRPTVRYESFAIAAGCDVLAVACSETRSVQIRALADIAPGFPSPTSEQRDHAFIETTVARSALDPNYLNPGPLKPRLAADLVWTGEEMIVWGGKQARDGLTTLVDGAAFNPDTDEWRPIASFPLQGPQATRAVWGDGEMIVVSHNGTFGYDPDTDSWRTIGNGVVPSEWHDRMLYFEGKVYVWARSSLINELTVETGQWRPIDGPETPVQASPFSGVLRATNGRVIAVTRDTSTGCASRAYWVLLGEEWALLPEFSLATAEYADCSTANQSASVSADIAIWGDENHPSAGYSTFRNRWRELPPIPLSGAEGPPGPVPMGTDHFLVPQWGDAAIYDASSEGWRPVFLPGHGTDAEMIWTGEEILAWGIGESFDAWRWTPGQTIIGGDDAR